MADMLQEGISLLKTGNLEEARAVFDRLIGKEPKNAPAHLWLGKCLALEGDLDKARKEFRSAAEHGDDIVRETAKLQLRTIMYNGFLKHLILAPPLRYVLFAAGIGYGMALILVSMGFEEISRWFGQVSIYGLLPLFFVWVFFIIAYVMGHLAFDQESKGRLVHFSRSFIGLAGVLVIPANLLIRFGPWVKILAIFLDVFLVSLFLSRVFNWVGQMMTGEDTPPIISAMFGRFDDFDSLVDDQE
ncbi:MAG TPA: hypothetical protein DCE42_04000 [Myxococcales bacterium]|nr:hypothetical protein [Deltaproteobacteria bacterium]HAA53889.1 hypothetical protein [Myxococcales bacterium]|tara:strand:+ start:11032 stop:11763 length:732 start_codon:yes stop_codon:yes gene_type:complete